MANRGDDHILTRVLFMRERALSSGPVQSSTTQARWESADPAHELMKPLPTLFNGDELVDQIALWRIAQRKRRAAMRRHTLILGAI